MPDRNASFFITKNFINCFIGDANHPELRNRIFLLYNYVMTSEYIKFERKLETVSNFSTDYDYSDDKRVMYVFDIPEQYADDYKLFLEGKYSQMSEEYKQTVLKFWDVKDKNNIFYNVLYAVETDEEGKEYYDVENEGQEIWQRPVPTREIYMNPN